jgi:hypothetical protein
LKKIFSSIQGSAGLGIGLGAGLGADFGWGDWQPVRMNPRIMAWTMIEARIFMSIFSSLYT